jgi:hypothetical protein
MIGVRVRGGVSHQVDTEGFLTAVSRPLGPRMAGPKEIPTVR